MHVLGVSCYYHDAAAAIVRDGRVIAAAAEERFSRKKHDFGFPEGAIRYCLEEAGIEGRSVDVVGFYEKPLLKFERLLKMAICAWPRSCGIFLHAMPAWLKERLRIEKRIRRFLALPRATPVLYGRHHASHAASAFLASPFAEAAILTTDGVGEWTTTAFGHGEGGRVELEREIRFPHSVGLYYSALTAFLGFRVNDAEWKVMGLAPYGRPRHADVFRSMIDRKPDGSFRLDLDYFAHHRSARRMFSRRWAEALGGPPREPGGAILPFHRDVAASGQLVLEELLLGIARHLHARYDCENLAIGGGVGLNSVANWKILRRTPFRRIFIQPAAGDDGGALGVALWIWSQVLGRARGPALEDVYLGPSFGDDAIEAFLRGAGARYERLDRAALLDRTAAAIASGRIVGWFQGRMEFGPRALGNRSILADPRDPAAKDRVNAKVKFREGFRPFAPSVPIGRAREFFDIDGPSPFMLLVPEVRPEKRSAIPAVTHVDGTARVQTVERRHNPLFHDLLEAFGRRTGVPVLLNTSFNVRGEPIVCTPGEAYRCFRRSGIDVLVLGPFYIAEKGIAPEEQEAVLERTAREIRD